MDIEQTYADRSPLSTLDPRTRLLGVVAFSVMVAILETPGALLCSLGLSLAFVVLSRIPFRVLVTRLFVFNLFIALLWLLVPWSIPGEKALAIGPAVVSREGVAYMAALTLRSNAIMLALVAFTASTGITAMTRAMTALRVPDKITYLFFLTYRYIGDIYSEYTRLVNAMRMRCFRPASNLHTYRSYAYLVGMLLVNSFERAQRVRSAMLCRGFNGRFPRVGEVRLSRLDILCLGMLCLVLTGIIYADG